MHHNQRRILSLKEGRQKMKANGLTLFPKEENKKESRERAGEITVRNGFLLKLM